MAWELLYRPANSGQERPSDFIGSKWWYSSSSVCDLFLDRTLWGTVCSQSNCVRRSGPGVWLWLHALHRQALQSSSSVLSRLLPQVTILFFFISEHFKNWFSYIHFVKHILLRSKLSSFKNVLGCFLTLKLRVSSWESSSTEWSFLRSAFDLHPFLKHKSGHKDGSGGTGARVQPLRPTWQKGRTISHTLSWGLHGVPLCVCVCLYTHKVIVCLAWVVFPVTVPFK